VIRVEVLEVGIEIFLRQSMVQEHFVEVLKSQQVHSSAAAYGHFFHRAQKASLPGNIEGKGCKIGHLSVAIQEQIQLEGFEDNRKEMVARQGLNDFRLQGLH